MPGPAETVAAFFNAMERRQWSEAAGYMANDVEVWWPVTDERFPVAGVGFGKIERSGLGGGRHRLGGRMGRSPGHRDAMAADQQTAGWPSQ